MADVCKYLTLSSSLRLEHKASMNLIQSVRYLASQLSSCQVFPANVLSSTSTVFLHVSIVRSVLIFFSRVKHTLGQHGGITRRTCPSHLHLLRFTSMTMLLMLVRLAISSLSYCRLSVFQMNTVTLSGGYILELLTEINCASEDKA